MKRGRKWVVLLLAAALFAAAAVAIVSLRSEPRTITLADGSTLTILKTSYGRTTHRMTRGGLWEKILYGWVPAEWLDLCRLSSSPATASLRRVIGLRAMQHISVTYTTTNTLVVWFRESSTNATSRSLSVFPIDENGQVWAASPATIYHVPASITGGPLPTGGAGTRSAAGEPAVFSFTYPAFPRRSQIVRFRVFAGTAVVGEFTIPNPARRDYPQWTATTAPVTVQREGYDFTLQKLWSGVDQKTPPQPMPEPEIGNLRAELDYARGGKNSQAWSIVGLEAEDATGNLWRSGGYSKQGERILFTAGRVPTNEALKVRATFLRRGDFDTNTVWRIRDVPLPSPGQFTTVSNATMTRDGMTFAFLGVSAPNVRFPGASGWGSSAQVHLSATPALGPTARDWRLSVVDVQDETGRSIGHAPFAMQPAPSLNTPVNFSTTNAARADFVFALHQPVTVEFMTRASVP